MSMIKRRWDAVDGRHCAAVTAGLLLTSALAGCATTPATPPADGSATAKRPGGYYLDDGPGVLGTAELDALAALSDPVPVQEALHPRANRPYRVLGNDYEPMKNREPFRQLGVASWYGRKFHGQLTSIGERYDMYQMTAAHPTLPLPSFVRVTNLENGRRVVVRVNDRGPFLHERAIDLSYLAAHKLGYLEAGSAKVEVELIDPATATLASPALPVSATVPAPALVNASYAPPPLIASAPVTAALASPAPVTAAPTTALPGGHYLQLGAFNARNNAEAAARLLGRQLEWLQMPIQVAPSKGMFRVQAGPFDLREQAQRAGEQVESRTGVRPLLLAR